MSEYNTPTQEIRRGSFGKSFFFSPQESNTSITLDDKKDIKPFLLDLIENGIIQPNPNTYYPIHFSPQYLISKSGKELSCAQFCAYHSSLYYTQPSDSNSSSTTKAQLFYGVIPDMSLLNCADGCGSSSTLQNTFSVSSHELAEVITNPSDAEPAWYDVSTISEIGDICDWQQGSLVVRDGSLRGVYTVQKEWSNERDNCIVSK